MACSEKETQVGHRLIPFDVYLSCMCVLPPLKKLASTTKNEAITNANTATALKKAHYNHHS